MPILKQIAGHGSCAPVQRYLEKNGRALTRDFFNFAEVPDSSDLDEPDVGGPFAWAEAMDAFRAACGNDLPWKGRAARTFKHFVISPAPEDGIDLPRLRELAHSWLARYFPDFQATIVYHDDNGIPHAHVVVNNTDVSTGRRMHNDDPKELNRGLQRLARKRDLSALGDEPAEPKTGFQRLSAMASPPRERPSTLQAEYRSRAERRAEAKGGYSWVADIRSRVSIARSLARNEGEFRVALQMMGVTIMASSPNARRPDWVFSLADAPTRRVSGERLGAAYGKEALERRFLGAQKTHLADMPSREFLRLARRAVELKDLGELEALSHALGACGKWRITSIDAAETVLATQRGRLDGEPPGRRRDRLAAEVGQLERARDYIRDNGIMPQREPEAPPSRFSRQAGWTADGASQASSPHRADRGLEERGGRQR